MNRYATPIRPLLLAAGLLASALPLQAQAQKLTPGLWENTVTMKSNDSGMNAAMAQAQQAMAALPPEQRKMMQDMMAKQGVSMGPKGNSVRACVSQAMVDSDQLPQTEGKCTRQGMQRNGNTLKFSYTCAGDTPVSGEGEFTFIDSKSYTGRTVTQVTAMGKPQRMEGTVVGKWISADCGALKPAR